MFFSDHVCDPKRLEKMVRNKSGQYAEDLRQKVDEMDEFECEHCKLKFKEAAEFCDHLEAHKLSMNERANQMNARVAHQNMIDSSA